MESSSQLKEKLKGLIDTIRDLEFFQQLKAKWEEVDPQSRTYLKFAGAGGTIILLFILILSSVWSVHALKTEYQAKQDLLHEIQSANEEVRRLRESMPNVAVQSNPGGDQQSGPWSGYLETVATTSGVDKASLSLSPEKPGATNEQSKEFLFDIALKHVNIKQVVRYAFNLENGARPVKLRHLVIDTKVDPSGFLDASLSISAFTVVTPK